MANPNTIVHAWHLEFIDRARNSRKFYRVYVTEGGITFLRWGRIGTAGQHNHTEFPNYDAARDVGLRQVYEKRAKGYVEKHGDFKFTASDTAIQRARQGDIYDLDSEWNEAVGTGEYEAAKTEVLKQYADFSQRIQNLLDQAPTGDLDTMLDLFESAETTWADIEDKHAEVNAAMSLLRATLMGKVVGV